MVALALLLVAPNVDGPLIVLVWAGAVGLFRLVVLLVGGSLPRLIVGGVFLWTCFVGAFWGGWFLIPAGVAFAMHDWRGARARSPDTERGLPLIP
jgi:hypothetical protein